MELYHVNLAEGLVPDARKRRKNYRLMIFYFLACGVFLVEGGYRVSNTVMQIRLAKLQGENIMRDFRKSHPGESSISSYVDLLKAKLAVKEQVLKELSEELPTQIPAMEMIHALLKSSPKYTDILAFRMAEDKEWVTWQCRVILTDDQEEISPDKLVLAWRNSPLLGEFVTNVMMIHLDDNEFVQGYPAIIISCQAALKKGEK